MPIFVIMNMTLERELQAYSIAYNWVDQAEKWLSKSTKDRTHGINKLSDEFDSRYYDHVANRTAEIYSEEWYAPAEGPIVMAGIKKLAIWKAKTLLKSGHYPITLQYVIDNWN